MIKTCAEMLVCENGREIWEKKNKNVKNEKRERERIPASVAKIMDANFQTIVLSSIILITRLQDIREGE